jgi:hypothetical protein
VTSSADPNTAVVRRFMSEVLEGRILDLLDSVLTPNDVNPALRGVDRAGFKALQGAMGAAIVRASRSASQRRHAS